MQYKHCSNDVSLSRFNVSWLLEKKKNPSHKAYYCITEMAKYLKPRAITLKSNMFI
jgi:hypothetical protein